MLDKKELDSILRVNHAGEFGAKKIYQGQIAASKNPQTKKILEEMLAGEEQHFNYFDQKIKEEAVRPTALYPIWNILGYGVGFATALMGEKAAFATTVAIEEVIEQHYQKQIDKLENSTSLDSGNKELLEKIKQFRKEELEHKEIAIENNALDAPFYKILEVTIKTGSKLAIFLSKKI